MAAKASAKLMRVIKSDSATFAEDWHEVCNRRVDSVLDVEKDVAKIIAEVRSGGDDALRTFVKKFDGAALDHFEVTPEEWDDACEQVDSADRAAISETV